MFKFPWLSHTLLAISYVTLSIFAFANNIRVLDAFGTARRCRLRGEYYDFSKEESDAILKIIASVSINIIVSLSLIIIDVSFKPLSWIPCAFAAFCLLLTLIQSVISLSEGYHRIFVPWVKREIFKNIKNGN